MKTASDMHVAPRILSVGTISTLEGWFRVVLSPRSATRGGTRSATRGGTRSGTKGTRVI